ncbi:MAG: hypothetical protein EXX96DRAFT_583693 [Benjaminiella poitrasii]|nr:MAG: hypothetical protein EXX96DRAFT_583693 [Benjaminiella poitrasii]
MSTTNSIISLSSDCSSLTATTTTTNNTLVVNNLDPKVTEDALRDIFKLISPVQNVKITRDNKINNCGYVNFYEQQAAEQALQTMDKRVIYSKEISVNWYDDDTTMTTDASASNSTSRRSSSASNDKEQVTSMANTSYEAIFAQTPLYTTSIMIQNLPKKVISQDIVPHLQQYGYVSDIYITPNQGEAIVKLDTHANAATAILALQNTVMAGNIVHLAWAKQQQDKLNNHNAVLSSPSPSSLFDAFSSISPKKLIHQITDKYENHMTMRPPAPTTTTATTTSIENTDESSNHTNNSQPHGWNQYYQHYYSAGHLTI